MSAANMSAAVDARIETTAAVDAHFPVKLKWGFMSTAGITGKNFTAVSTAKNAEIVAVASRDVAKAKAWAEPRAVGKAYGSYEELLADSEVEAVYCPLPTNLHVEWVPKIAASGKKAVLCEKPTASCLEDVQTMIAACREHGCQWMDGVMFNHHARLRYMERHIRPLASGGAPEIGVVKRVTCGFTFSADAAFLAGDIRTKASLEPLGCIGDLAWYCVRFACWAFNYDTPTHASAIAHEVNAEGVPISATGTVCFTGGRIATFDCGFTTAFRQWAEVAGTTGSISLDDFCIARSSEECEYKLTKAAGPVDHHRRIAGEYTTVSVLGCNQEAAMFETLSGLALAGERDPFWEKVTLQTQAGVDALMASIATGKGEKVPLKPLGCGFD